MSDLVYVIGPESGPVKIGYTSKSVQVRLSTLQIGSPVTLFVIATIEGPLELEKYLHRLCVDYRLHGEWFEWKGTVKETTDLMISNPNSLLEKFNSEIPEIKLRHKRQGPRADAIANLKPWEAFRVSRRTWYRYRHTEFLGK